MSPARLAENNIGETIRYLLGRGYTIEQIQSGFNNALKRVALETEH